MQRQDNPGIYVMNEKQEKAFGLIREGGTLQLDVKMRCRDKRRTTHVLVEAIDAVDQIVAAMTREERLQAFQVIGSRLK